MSLSRSNRALVGASVGLLAARSLWARFRRRREGRAQRDAEGAALQAERERLRELGQAHLLDGYERLSTRQQAALMEEIKALDIPRVNRVFRASTHDAAEPPKVAGPAAGVVTKGAQTGRTAAWRAAGLRAIDDGKVAVLLLAGGQGTRLGSTAPKGCYDIGLPSRKSLFQLQAERIKKLQSLAKQSRSSWMPMQKSAAAAETQIRWYIMTSGATHKETKRHFRQHGFFGLDANQVVFFQQGSLPCLTPQGSIVMESKSRLSSAPDGNGGLYGALKRSRALADMVNHGVRAVDCYCVDNALAQMCEPTFVGYCMGQNAEVGARVVAKAHAKEPVGVFARDASGSTRVVEYSELPEADATAVDPATARLRYNWANICMHYFTVPFLQRAATALEEGGQFHLARKMVPSKTGRVSAIKLEQFIFDTFPMTKRLALFEVDRAEHFAPVKNAPGSAADSPDTARAALMALHARWLEAAGGTPGTHGVELAPSVTYGGEGLEGVEVSDVCATA